MKAFLSKLRRLSREPRACKWARLRGLWYWLRLRLGQNHWEAWWMNECDMMAGHSFDDCVAGYIVHVVGGGSGSLVDDYVASPRRIMDLTVPIADGDLPDERALSLVELIWLYVKSGHHDAFLVASTEY